MKVKFTLSLIAEFGGLLKCIFHLLKGILHFINYLVRWVNLDGQKNLFHLRSMENQLVF